jgi:predicted lipoprotein with Yx(FWY)xxD motif
LKQSVKGEKLMKKSLLCGALLTLALVLAACGPAAPALTAIPTELQPLATEIVGTAQPLATEIVGTATGLAGAGSSSSTSSTETMSVPPVITTQTTETSQASVPVTGAVTIKSTLSDTHGQILTDENGVAVYALTKDTQKGTTSACTDQECTSKWKPVTTQAAPVAGQGVVQNLLGTITRQDGTMQVTYNGWPLYYLISETTSGTTNGQGMENEWFLLSPSGNMIKQ